MCWLNCDLRWLLGRWCKEGARVVELAYTMAVYASAYYVNTLGELKMMCLKDGIDRNKLNMLLGEHDCLRDWL